MEYLLGSYGKQHFHDLLRTTKRCREKWSLTSRIDHVNGIGFLGEQLLDDL